MNTAHRMRGAWPLASALAWLAATIGARPLAVPDEGRYVGVAWAMLTGGDWLVPHLNGLPYFHKPPLFYWITAVALSVFGHVEWAARLAPLIGAAAGTTAAYLFARRWWSESFARLALVALVTQPLLFIGAQFANLDMLVAGCIAVTIFAFAHAALLRAAGAPIPRWVLATGYLFTALGVLAKGLIGIVLPGMVLVAWLLLRRQWRTIFTLLLWWPGWLLFLAVAGPWFVLMQREFAEFSYYFFYVQHFARFTRTTFNNPQPAYFYPVVLGVLALPWSLWMLAGLRRRPEPEPLRTGLRQLLWLWAGLITLFFSLPHSKLVGYILPVAYPLGLLAADTFARVAVTRRRLWLWRGGAAAGLLAGVVAVGYAAVQGPHSLAPLGKALAARMEPGDRVMFLQGYYFDIPFYARLRAPVVVVDEWNNPSVMSHDNWRRELADAAEFAPRRGEHLLVLPQDMAAVACGGGTTWIVGGDSADERYPVLDAARVVAEYRHMKLWRLDVAPVRPAACPEMPIENPASRS
jgi:4-amino-4-deoxy-L-arabinose transferase-like glycosyltransferase